MAKRKPTLNAQDLWRYSSYISEVTEFAKKLVRNLEEENKRQFVGERHLDGTSYVVEAELTTILTHDILQIAKSLAILLSYQDKFISHMVTKSLLALSDQLINVPSAWVHLIEILWEIAKSWSCGLRVEQGNEGPSSSGLSHKRSDQSVMIMPSFRNSAIGDEKILTYLKILETTCLSNGRGSMNGASQVITLLKRMLKACLLHHSIFSEYVQKFLTALDNNFVQIVNETLGLFADQTVDRKGCSLLDGASVSITDKGLMLGALLQLLSSVASVLAPDALDGDTYDMHLHICLLEKLSKLLPTIACDPLLQGGEHPDVYSISLFLRHKMLMLEVRLSPRFESNLSLALSSLVVLQLVAKNLLEMSLFWVDLSAMDCEYLSSPFASSFVGELNLNMTETQKISLEQHLYRRAIFLLIKAFHSLGHDKKKSKEEHLELISAGEMIGNSRVIQRDDLSKQSAVLLVRWIQLQLQEVPRSDSLELRLCMGYGDKFFKFALRLVHLYMEEDILLLDLLLLLMDFYDSLSYLRQEDVDPLATSLYVSEDLQNILLEAFAPLSIFHAFLAWLKYDASVVVDFLISDTTGTVALRYLIRCIRFIVRTWPSFLRSRTRRVDFAVTKPATKEQCCLSEPLTHCCEARHKHDSIKREKQGFLAHCYEIEASASAKRKRKSKDPDGASACSSARTTIDENGFRFGVREQKNYPEVCSAKALQCLLCLKESIARLHRKGLFPYNPSALVSRLELLERLSGEDQS